MDISLIMTLTGLTFSVHVGKGHMEGSVAQNFDKRLSFYFIVCRIWHFEKKKRKKSFMENSICKTYPFLMIMLS